MDCPKASEALPLTEPANPTAKTLKIYYITPHNTLTSVVNIIDLNPYLDRFSTITREDLIADPHGDTPESLKVLQKEAKTVLKEKAPVPWLTCTKNRFWSSRYVVSSQTAAGLAELKVSPWWGSSTINFTGSSLRTDDDDDAWASQEKADGTPAPRLPITVKAQHWYSRGMFFVVNSILYRWAMDSTWHSRRFTLYKGVSAEFQSGKSDDQGGESCGKCLIGWSSLSSATIVVDTQKVDFLTAILTGFAVLNRVKTSRQGREWSTPPGAE